jgi:hypothetical protein
MAKKRRQVDGLKAQQILTVRPVSGESALCRLHQGDLQVKK